MFEDICKMGKDNHLPYCIVLTDSFQHMSYDYFALLQDKYKYLTQKVIYNMVDINLPINEWYLKWLCPVSTPLTCVFSPDGKLIDLIPGAVRETFLYTKVAITNLETTDYHWPNQFHMNKKQVIPLLNNLLEQIEVLNQGIYLSSGLNPLVDTLYYPYSVYLKLLGELLVHDSVSSKRTAQSLLEFETPYSLDLYKDEFITAKKVLNPDFNILKEPNIRVDEKIILLPNCIVNETVPIVFPIYNDGNSPLLISKIHVSCSCLEKVQAIDGGLIGANDFVVAQFKFTPDGLGEVSRDIFVTSNAINTPILHINILANVISK